jgi:hypothetical protein
MLWKIGEEVLKLIELIHKMQDFRILQSKKLLILKIYLLIFNKTTKKSNNYRNNLIKIRKKKIMISIYCHKLEI